MDAQEEKIKLELAKAFKDTLARDVELTLLPDKDFGEESTDLKEFLEQIASLSPKLSVRVGDKTAEVGPILKVGENLGYKLEFWGAPSGLEVQSLIKAIVLASQGPEAVLENIAKGAGEFPKPVELTLFATTTCPYCPSSAFFLISLAVASKEKAHSKIVMTSSFPELTKSFGIQSVPALVVDGKKETLKTGVMPLPELISYIKSSI